MTSRSVARFRVDRDLLLVLGFRELGQVNGQEAILELCLAMLIVDREGKRDLPLETPKEALRIAELLLVAFLLAADQEHPVLDEELDVLLLQARDLDDDQEFLVAVLDVQLRPLRRHSIVAEAAKRGRAEQIVEETVHLATEAHSRASLVIAPEHWGRIFLPAPRDEILHNHIVLLRFVGG